ncbi:hypothetical protein ABPG77_009170 [Micractinium sp. CCAP 211/92]
MDKIPHLAAEGTAFFRTGKLSGGGSSRDIILRAQNVLFRLHAALLAAEKEQIQSCLGPLLDLADALTATAHRGLPKLATPSSGTNEAAELDDETAAELQLKLICNAAYASTLLLRWVLPACSSSTDSRGRVVAASAVLVSSELALSALSDLVPCNPALYTTLAQLLEGMGEVLRQCALPPQLQQSNALQSWLQYVVGLVRDDCIMHFPGKWGARVSVSRLGYPPSMDAFLGCMAALGTADERLEGHRAAVCADSQLMGELAALTATMHANMPLCAHEGDAWRAERAMSDLLRWAASWNDLPWPGDNEPEQPAAVQVAAARIMQGEVQLLQKLALPETLQAVQRWQQALAAIAPLSSLLLGPCCSPSRQCQVVLALAEAGPAIARFFPAAAAVLGRSAAAAPEAAAAPPAQGSREAGGHAVGAEEASRGGYAAADARLLQGTLCSLISTLNSIYVLLDCSTPAELAAANSGDKVARLATASCKLSHALCQLSRRHRQILGLSMADGLFPLGVATTLILVATRGALCLLKALQATRPHPGDAEAAVAWDRQYACCLLEATAAMAVGWELTPNNAWKQEVKYGPREGLLGSLGFLAAQSVGQELSSASQGEEAVLAAFGRQLCSEDGRQHLPTLLQRLLPAGGGAGSEGAAAQPPPLPLEASLFQAWALGQASPQCANLRCPTLPAGDDLAGGRGKLCGGCRTVRYCSLACSQQDWRAHKSACRALQAGVGANSA